MKRKILVKDVNYDSKIERRELEFKEKSPKILFTGKKKEKGIEENVTLFLSVRDLLLEKCKTDDLTVYLESHAGEKEIKVNLDNVETKRFVLKVKEGSLMKLKGREIKGNLEIRGGIKEVDLNKFENASIFYWGKKGKKIKRIIVKNGNYFILLPQGLGNEKIPIKEIEFLNVEKVNLLGVEFERFKRFNLSGVKKLILNIETIKNLKSGDWVCPSCLYLFVCNVEEIETFLKKCKQGIIDCFKVFFNISNVEQEHSGLKLKGLLEKNLSLKEVLEIRNIETRRLVLQYLGGVSKLLEKEKDRVLLEKTDKGELWAVGDAQNPEKCIKFLKYKDTSTNREYISFVPPTIRSVKQGFAWKFQIREDEYDEILSES